MNLPFCEDDACALERLRPGNNVMVNAIDKSSVEIKENGGEIGASQFAGSVMRRGACGLRAL